MINEIYPIIGIIPCNLSDTVELKVVKKPQKTGLTIGQPHIYSFYNCLIIPLPLAGNGKDNLV